TSSHTRYGLVNQVPPLLTFVAQVHPHDGGCVQDGEGWHYPTKPVSMVCTHEIWDVPVLCGLPLPKHGNCSFKQKNQRKNLCICNHYNPQVDLHFSCLMELGVVVDQHDLLPCCCLWRHIGSG